MRAGKGYRPLIVWDLAAQAARQAAKSVEPLVFLGIDKGRLFRELPTPVTIGREEGNLLRLNDERVSRYHAKIQCDNGEIIVEGAPVSSGPKALITQAGDYRLFFGWRSDPFFFDAHGLFNQMQFTGDDFFADQDVCSIVLELPHSALGADEVGLWARTLDNTKKGGFRQIAAGDHCKQFSCLEKKGERT